MERSLSFGYNRNLSDTNNKEELILKPQKALNSLNKTKTKNNDFNYTSIEKLDILKPQSKDYILCFDTSSIDQNSSVASDQDENNFKNCTNVTKTKYSSTKISEELTSKADSLKQSTECSDSGVETARSPMSHSHDTVLGDLENSSEGTDKIYD